MENKPPPPSNMAILRTNDQYSQLLNDQEARSSVLAMLHIKDGSRHHQVTSRPKQLQLPETQAPLSITQTPVSRAPKTQDKLTMSTINVPGGIGRSNSPDYYGSQFQAPSQSQGQQQDYSQSSKRNIFQANSTDSYGKQKTSFPPSYNYKPGKSSRLQYDDNALFVPRKSDLSKDLNLNIDIPCLNCDQLIEYKDVDQHSLVCTQVKSRVMLLEKPKTSNTALRVEQRGKTLLAAVEKKIAQASQLLAADESYLHAIINYTKRLLQIRDYDKTSLVNCRKLWQDLMFMYGSPLEQTSRDSVAAEEAFNGSPFTMIYLDRLRNLVREKYAEMRVALSELMRQQEEEGNSPKISSRGKQSVYNLPMGGSAELMSIYSEESHTDRQEKLNSLKKEKLQQMRSTIAQREKTIEKLMRRSHALNDSQKDLIAEEIKSVYSGTSGQRNKLEISQSMRQYAVLQDVNSQIERGSLRGYSLRSGTSQAPSDSEFTEAKLPEGKFQPSLDPKIQELDEVLQTEDQRKREQLNKDMRIHFAQQFAKMKQQFPSRHDAHKVPFDSLYQAVKAQRLPVREWPEFILRELRHNAKQWVDPSRVERLKKQVRIQDRILHNKNINEGLIEHSFSRQKSNSMRTIDEEEDPSFVAGDN